MEDTNTILSQKRFCEDILKCNISEKTVQGTKYYVGITRKETIVIDDDQGGEGGVFPLKSLQNEKNRKVGEKDAPSQP